MANTARSNEDPAAQAKIAEAVHAFIHIKASNPTPKAYTDWLRSLWKIEGFGTSRSLAEQIIYCSGLSDPGVRDDAAELMGHLQVMQKEITTTLPTLMEDSSLEVRCSAMMSCAVQGLTQFTPRLIRQYQSSTLTEKRWVLLSLQRMRDPSARDFLLDTFQRTHNEKNKYRAAAALAASGDAEYLAFLQQSHTAESDPDKKAYLANILTELETPQPT